MSSLRTKLAPGLALAALGALLLLGLVGEPITAGAPDRILTPLADGFDFPVGKPDAENYYRSRGFWPNGHLGDDWNGRGGGNTDLGDPVYSIADGVVVVSDDFRRGWGHCVIIRHAYRDKNGEIRMVDSLYAHLDRRMVRTHQIVRRGQQVGTIGTAHGRYYAHLHFEIRKNLQIGMNRTKFPRDYSCYYSPTPFIQANRKLRSTPGRFAIPVNTFAPYGQDLPSSSSSAPTPGQSVVPVRDSVARGGDGDRQLKPELQRILEDTTREEPGQEKIESFWSRLRERFRSSSPAPEADGSRARSASKGGPSR